jgi:hypothetical protein
MPGMYDVDPANLLTLAQTRHRDSLKQAEAEALRRQLRAVQPQPCRWLPLAARCGLRTVRLGFHVLRQKLMLVADACVYGELTRVYRTSKGVEACKAAE